MEYHLFISNIIVHVGVLAVFLTIFFFTIAITVEKSIVAKQVNFIVEVIVNNIFKGVKDDKKQKLLDDLNKTMENIDFTEADKEVKKSNDEIFKKSLTFIGILLLVVSILLIIIGYLNKWSINHIKLLGLGALMSLLFVAITESSFLILIAANYLSADPNQIREKIVDDLFENRK